MKSDVVASVRHGMSATVGRRERARRRAQVALPGPARLRHGRRVVVGPRTVAMWSRHIPSHPSLT